MQEERNLISFGDRVKPGDADRVLMWWKSGDDRYRVIYGDLRADTTVGDELPEPEDY